VAFMPWKHKKSHFFYTKFCPFINQILNYHFLKYSQKHLCNFLVCYWCGCLVCYTEKIAAHICAIFCMTIISKMKKIRFLEFINSDMCVLADYSTQKLINLWLVVDQNSFSNLPNCSSLFFSFQQTQNKITNF